MAPREVPKSTATHKAQRVMKTVATRARSSPASPATLQKAVSSVKKTVQKVPLKMSNTTQGPRQRTNTVPKAGTPKAKEKKSAPTPATAAESAKKPLRKRRPMPAHSGVPVPEKMKQLMQRNFRDINDL